MRKTAFCILAVLVFSLCLCACGNRDTGLDDLIVGTPIIPETSPEISPMISPMITPDMEDGIVTDRDGRIENNDSEAQTNEDENKTNKTTVSPSPKPTSEP